MSIKTDLDLPLEKRKYTENASTEEITTIKNRVYLHRDDIIFFYEVPLISPFSVNLTFDEINSHAKKMGPCGLIIDVSICDKPDAIARRVINQRFKNMEENIKEVAFVVKSNVIVRTIIKFVMFQSNLESFSINRTVAEAELSINKILND